MARVIAVFSILPSDSRLKRSEYWCPIQHRQPGGINPRPKSAELAPEWLKSGLIRRPLPQRHTDADELGPCVSSLFEPVGVSQEQPSVARCRLYGLEK